MEISKANSEEHERQATASEGLVSTVGKTAVVIKNKQSLGEKGAARVGASLVATLPRPPLAARMDPRENDFRIPSTSPTLGYS